VFSIGVEPSVGVVYDAGGTTDKGGFGVQIEPLAAMRLRVAGFRLGLRLRPGFGREGTAQFAALQPLARRGPQAAPPSASVRPIRDLDGIPDDNDACPGEAGPSSHTEAERLSTATATASATTRLVPGSSGDRVPDPKANGCPDVDNDGLLTRSTSARTSRGEASADVRLARLKGRHFEITPPIEFNGRDQLSAEAEPHSKRSPPPCEQTRGSTGASVSTKGASQRSGDRRRSRSSRSAIKTLTDRYEVVPRRVSRTAPCS
jgi:hypothetical protein